jgi:phenylalanyl-tRNA synthetase beta chain
LPHAEAQDRLRERIVALGYQEIVEIPIVDTKRDEIFRPEGLIPATIGNPLAEDAAIMRSSGTVSMLRAIEWNLNHGQRNLRLFEIGKTYELRNGEPVETQVLTLGATGLAREKSVEETARSFGFPDLKGDLDSTGHIAGELIWKSGAPQWLNSARSAQISLSDVSGEQIFLGFAGQIARRVADLFKFRQEVFVAELKLDPLLIGVESAAVTLRFKPIPRFPAVSRDFSFVFPQLGQTFQQTASIIAVIRDLGIPEVSHINIFDRFEGKGLKAGTFAIAFRVTFQSAEATFTDPQLNDYSSRIVAALQRKLGATLRTT